MQLRKAGRNAVGTAAALGTNLSPERSRRADKSRSKNFQIKPDCGRKKSENSARLASPPLSVNGKRGASLLFQVSQTSAFQRSESAESSALNTPARLPRIGVIKSGSTSRRVRESSPPSKRCTAEAVRESSVAKPASGPACDSAS